MFQKLKNKKDSIRSLAPREQMSASAIKLRDTYAGKPNAPFVQKTFGLWYCLDTWYENGLDREIDLDEFF
ncbi:hypothetical protein KJ766_00910, partial [Patescibacteria group bacterium]|nr:hypothetical protein [Patescibacteria group bacterium]